MRAVCKNAVRKTWLEPGSTEIPFISGIRITACFMPAKVMFSHAGKFASDCECFGGIEEV